jgi:hypothetical protein
MAPKKAGRIPRRARKSKSFFPSSQDDEDDEDPYDIMDYLFY